MQGPEVEARNGVVVTRIAEVEETQKLLVDEEKPEEPMVLARTAMKREREIRWIAKRGKNVPGRRNHECNQSSGKWVQAFPCAL